jgi:drug/metabolite transporter (DMT)-like permease
MNREKLINWVIFILLSFIWGSSFILMKVSSRELNGWQIGSLRIFSAGIVFLPFAVFHFSQVPLRKLPLIILSALLGNLIPAILFAVAIDKGNESSLAGVLNSLTPLFVIVIGILFFKAKLYLRKIMGVLIGFTGLLILSFTKEKITTGDLGATTMILLATLLYGININLVGLYLRDVNSVKLATVSLAFMCIPSGIILWQQHVFFIAFNNAHAQRPIAAAVLLGISGTAIATVFFYSLIKRAGGLFASLVTYAIPVVAILWGVWDGEKITAIQVSCLAIILSGVYLVNKKPKQS